MRNERVKEANNGSDLPMSIGVHRYVFLHKNVVTAVDYDASLLGFANGIFLHDATRDVARHVFN